MLSVDHALIVSGLKNQEKVLVKAEIGENLEVSAYRNFSLVACKVEAEGSKGTVYTGEFDMLIVGAVTNLTQSWWQSTLDTTRSQSQTKLSSWMKTLSVPEQHLPFATEMLSQTLSMLCKEDSYIGLCDFAHIGTKHQAY